MERGCEINTDDVGKDRNRVWMFTGKEPIRGRSVYRPQPPADLAVLHRGSDVQSHGTQSEMFNVV